MTDDINLNDGDPSCEVVRRWGYDENLHFIEQDEDLVLHDAKYVPVLIELAADANCPKNDYTLSILSYFSQLTVLFKLADTANEIAAHIAASPHRSEPRLDKWIEYFRSIYDRLLHPCSMMDSDMESFAKQLLNGQYAHRRFERTGRVVDGFHEFTCYTDSYRGYVYIDPNTGRWQQSRYNALKLIDA
jgi:hypothetical protein